MSTPSRLEWLAVATRQDLRKLAERLDELEGHLLRIGVKLDREALENDRISEVELPKIQARLDEHSRRPVASQTEVSLSGPWSIRVGLKSARGWHIVLLLVALLLGMAVGALALR